MRQSSNNKNYTNNIATQPRIDERMPIDLCERSIPIGYIVSQFNDCEHKSEYTFTSCSAASSSTLIGSQPQLRGLYPQAVVGIIQITVSNATLVGKLNKGEAKVLLDGDGRWAMGDALS
ncbi:hypothetical protein C9I99_15820 [Photobacterium lutimaris]|uniref:Uncharacterized protein n=1 Tax=Photobacterium lutimaris TaxID=388278 RepID=A0A2T3IX71_9GAMM|nr:hypothetical protein C9I99_15820 [Photobacterium lutimaris]